LHFARIGMVSTRLTRAMLAQTSTTKPAASAKTPKRRRHRGSTSPQRRRTSDASRTGTCPVTEAPAGRTLADHLPPGCAPDVGEEGEWGRGGHGELRGSGVVRRPGPGTSVGAVDSR